MQNLFVEIKHAFLHFIMHLRLVGQEGDVDLRQSLDDFGSPALHQLIKERIGACWKISHDA